MSLVQLFFFFCRVVSFKYGIENENLLASTKDALFDFLDQNETDLIFLDRGPCPAVDENALRAALCSVLSPPGATHSSSVVCSYSLYPM